MTVDPLPDAPRRPELPDTASSDGRFGSDGDEAAPLVEADLLVEEVSIDGMCGVY